MPDAKNSSPAIVITAGLILAFACVDFATPQLMYSHRVDQGVKSQWPVALALGACIAQVTLIAAWAVFAPGNIVVRLPWSLLLGLMMWYVLAFSQQLLYGSPGGGGEIAQLGINLLLGVSALQIPLWITKKFFRYRMLAPGQLAAATTDERMQFELKHMLIGTLLFAISLSPLRVVIPKEAVANLRLQWQMFFFVGVAILVNLVATLPCLWGGFVSNSRAIALGFGWLLYALAVTGLELLALCIVLNSPRDLTEAFFLFYLVNVSQGAVVFGVMRAYRALGYRLERVPRELPAAEPERLPDVSLDDAEVETESDPPIDDRGGA